MLESHRGLLYRICTIAWIVSFWPAGKQRKRCLVRRVNTYKAFIKWKDIHWTFTSCTLSHPWRIRVAMGTPKKRFRKTAVRVTKPIWLLQRMGNRWHHRIVGEVYQCRNRICWHPFEPRPLEIPNDLFPSFQRANLRRIVWIYSSLSLLWCRDSSESSLHAYNG